MISEVTGYGNNRFGCVGGGDVWCMMVVMAAVTVWGMLMVVEGVDMDWGRCGIRGDSDGNGSGAGKGRDGVGVVVAGAV